MPGLGLFGLGTGGKGVLWHKTERVRSYESFEIFSAPGVDLAGISLSRDGGMPDGGSGSGMGDVALSWS